MTTPRLQRHVLLLWIAVTLVFAALGLAPGVLDLQRLYITRLDPGFSAEGFGFSPSTAATLFTDADPEFKPLVMFDTWMNGMPTGGKIRTSWFPIAERFYLIVAGYPNVPGGCIWVELQESSGATTTFQPSLENIGERWGLSAVHIPDAARYSAFRLVAAASQTQAWFGFSEPFLLAMPPLGQFVGISYQLLALVAATGLVFMPGLALRGMLRGRGRELPFVLLPIFGSLLAACLGAGIWIFAGKIAPQTLVLGFALPLLLGMAWYFRGHPLAALTTPLERRVLAIALLAAALATAKASYAVGPTGDLYQDRISRTLEVGDRSDSRISYHVIQLVMNGVGPYSERAKSYFDPWSFSARGPLSGLAAATFVGLAGAKPPAEKPEAFWRPFDRQGFAAYRIAMIAMAAATFVCFFGLVSLNLAPRWAFFALAVAATTPFLLHETYFTWPKLQAAGYACAAAWLLARRRPCAAGLCLGLGYLVHPLVLLSAPAFACLAAFSVCDESRPRLRPVLAAWAGFGLVFASVLAAWQLFNWGHFGQGIFWEYLVRSEKGMSWFATRLHSVLNTLAPMHLYWVDATNQAVNSFGGQSSGVVHFFFQYWNTAPFGFGIVAAPVLLAGLYSAARRHPWQFTAFAVLPFVLFAVYWGVCITGMMREGLHVWVLSLIYLFALGWQSSSRQNKELGAAPRLLLGLRGVEILAMLLVPAAVSTGQWLRFPLNDTLAIGAMAVFVALLARQLWHSPRDPE